ncbi:MAG: PAS domain-containing protein [Xanthobacteraceae bacterium]
MAELSEKDTAKPTWTDVASELSQAALGTSDWRDIARNVASMLSTPRLDWDALSRAAAQVRTGFATNNAEVPGATRMLDAVVEFSVNKAAQRASAEMIAACTPDLEPEDMLGKVHAILLKYVPFDLFSYSEYYHEIGPQKNVSLVRGRFSLDGNEPFRWPARWIEVPPEIVRWIESSNRSVSNIDTFYSEHPEAEALRNHVVTQEYTRRGITSFVVATRMDGGRVAASLTLGRRAAGKFNPFNDSDQKYLDSFHLELVLRMVGQAFQRRTVDLAQAIAALFKPGAEAHTIAKQAVRKLGEGFGLEYVGLFRVNRARRKFEVVTEYDPDKKLQVSEGYTQDLDAGMLGHVLRGGRALYAPNVRTEPPPFNYKPAGITPASSAMCLPIRLRPQLDAEVEWIIDLESSQLDAFPDPEQAALEQLVRDVERSLQLWFEARLCAVLLDLVDQGVILLGEGTRIERANRAARRLLGLNKEDSLPLPLENKYSNLEAFGADRPSREIIAAGDASASGAYLRLTGPDGVERRALAGASYRDDAFNRRVWLLGDVEHVAWVGSLRYMEMAVRTVAAQAHGGLLLASALMKRALKGMDANAPAYPLVDRALRSLTVADIPYERVASVYDVVTEPRRGKGILDIRALLLRFSEALPENERKALRLDLPPDGPLAVKGDPERLAFAFRSLLGHLLYIRLPAALLRVHLTAGGGTATVEIVLDGANPDAAAMGSEIDHNAEVTTRDQIAYAERLAFSAAALGFDAVRAVIEAHGGELRQPTGSAGELRFRIQRLSLATPRAHKADRTRGARG